ncbi:SSI family serine proteinase inhibitor [Actinoallomurus soli]|uniref:SSI family serine proteinase inhibitor n=1 Tax=Actinoallomurus soli TaxID=2952535 RepID=UPI0020922BCF|nr:SSI family serine proteinase inhibitor [Actinoallomurus soli]MCO5973812.1 subtilase-type protease inhibitor [Actinoallomurus soli]
MTATAVAAGSVAVSVTAAPTASAAADALTLSLSSPLIGTRTVTLTCEPTGGTHPAGDAACQDLIAANGDIARIPPYQLGGCGGYYDPTVASAVGHWRGLPVNYTNTFSNPCVANIVTGGHVFRF